MSIPGLGDALTLYDLSWRIATFINDLRHAQDDFLGLRAEADTLLICINSLNSPPCLEALYNYITERQGRDLATIVRNTEMNMVDLNRFIAKCSKLVEDDVGVKGAGRKRGWGRKLRELIAKGWARYKFTMTDKQAFRDKLILPTQGINIFLTSMTHVGLANVGALMNLSPAVTVPVGAGAGRGQVGGGVVAVNNEAVKGWRIVGRRTAFKKEIFKAPLTEEMEEHIVAYAQYLAEGGRPVDVSVGSAAAVGGTKYKVTKTTKVKTRSRSRSRVGLGLGKDTGGMYVTRKKSVTRPSSERVEIVQREWHSDDDSDGRPPPPMLALPAPDRPASPQVVEIIPSASSSDGPDERMIIHNDRRRSSAAKRDTEHRRAKEGEARREREHRPSVGDHRHTPRHTTRPELQARSRNIRARIRQEQEQALAEMEGFEAISRVQRAQSRRHRPTHLAHSREEEARMKEEEAQMEKEDTTDDAIEYLEREYGLVVVPLEIPRAPIDNGRVRPAAPADEEAVSSNSDSDAGDPPIIPSMARVDRLKAETSYPVFTGHARDRSYMASRRWEPYNRRRRGSFEGMEYPMPERMYEPYGEEHRSRPQERSMFGDERSDYQDEIRFRPAHRQRNDVIVERGPSDGHREHLHPSDEVRSRYAEDEPLRRSASYGGGEGEFFIRRRNADRRPSDGAGEGRYEP